MSEICLPAAKPGPLDRRLLLAARRARDAIAERCGIRLSIVRERSTDARPNAIVLALDSRAAVSPRAATARDAYRLQVGSRGAQLAAPAVEGLVYGLQTLADLVDGRGRIPGVEVLDQPDFLDRGIMLDVSRGKVPTRRTLEELVDLCARLRLNVLMLYVEHTFDFKGHPEIGADSDPLDAETLLALDLHAADRGVELVPCLQSLGHMEKILSLDRYADLAESDRRWSVSPALPETYTFLRELYDEFLPLFRSNRLNANCDEPFDLGRGRSAARAARHGPGTLFADHVERLRRMAGTHGKRLMIWADFALKNPDQIDLLDREVVLLDWWYEKEFDADRIGRLRRQGFEVCVCPGTSSWNCLFPRQAVSQANISRWADAGRRHRASGLLNTDWGDHGHYNALGVSLMAYAWGAQESWSGALSDRDFDRAFARRVFGRSESRVARIYRRLGSIHEAGFPIFNGSALQYLYFDSLTTSFFLSHAQRGALKRSRRALDRVLVELEALQGSPGRESGDDAEVGFEELAIREVDWAARATKLSVEKSLAALDYNAWCTDPSSLAARERRTLAKLLDELATTQHAQLAEFQSLWLARSHRSELARNQRRIRQSISSLRLAARKLRAGTAPRPPRVQEMNLTSVLAEVRRSSGLE